MSIRDKLIRGIYKLCLKSPAEKVITEGMEHASSSLVKSATKAAKKAIPLVDDAAKQVVAKSTKVKPQKVTQAFSTTTNTIKGYASNATAQAENTLIKRAAKLTDEVADVAKSTSKTASKVAQKTNPLSIKLTDVLPKDSPYYKFSKETQKLFKNVCDDALNSAMHMNNPEKYIAVISNLKSLSTHVDEEVIKVILKDKHLFNKYMSLIQRLPKMLGQKAMTGPEIQTVLTKLATMGTLDEKAFNALMKSKEMQEILAGRLDISYLKGISSPAKVGENFIAKTIEASKEAAQKHLADAGIDTKLTEKFFNAADRKIKADSQYIKRFVSQVERIKNPEFVNKILRQTNFDKNFLKYSERHLINILKHAEINPAIVNKALMIEHRTLFGLNHTIQTMSSRNTFRISDDLFNTFVKIQKKNPRHFSPSTITSLNNFLHVSNGNEKLAKKLLESADKLTGTTSVDHILSHATKDNIAIIEKCIEKGRFTAEDIFRIDKLAQYANKIPKDKLDKLYNDVYKPIYEALDVVDRETIAMKIVDIRLTRPGLYAKMESMKILELIKARKINPRIIDDIARGDLKPEMISDMQKILKGESLIKRFKSTKEALKHTISGDVVSIDGRLYINNNGKIDPWNMTEEKFNKLFPLVDRFAPVEHSNKGSNFLLTSFDELYRNPQTRAQYYKMFEQKGDDICVTIPAYKNIMEEMRFTDNEIFEQATGAPTIQLLEKTYAQATKPRSLEKNPFAIEFVIGRKKTYAPTG